MSGSAISLLGWKFSRLSALFLGILFLTACGNEAASGSTVNDSIQTTIIGGRTGGAWSVFTEGVAESVRREHDGAMITVEPGGIVENPPTVGTGTVPYGMSYAMTAYAAYRGEEPYDKSYEDIRAVSVVVPANYYQFIVKANTPYDSFEALIENKAALRLSVDQKGSAGEIITRHILKEYGITYNDIISWGGSVDHLDDAKTFELMADNRIDATGDAVSVPSSDIIEASTTMDLKLFSINPEIMEAVSDDLGMETGTIEAGSYPFVEEDKDTVNTPAILIVHKDVPEEEVYEVTKSIYENLDYLGTVHKEFKNLTEQKMMDVGQVPLHPGAEKFFREKGFID